MSAANPLAPGDVLEFKMFGYLSSDAWENVLHYVLDVTSGDGNILDDLAFLNTELFNSIAAAWSGLLSTRGKLTGTRLTRVEPTKSPVDLAGRDLDGTDASDPLPGFNACVFRKETDASGRAGIGHVFFPCVPENLANGDYINTTDARLIAVQNALDLQLVTAGWTITPVVYHRDAHSYDVVRNVGILGKIGRQSRRKPRL